jgi:GNAT superfamily N-acetyltransferase
VIEDVAKSRIVGAGTILVERKFVHHNGLVGHIEDIVTHSEYRGHNLGRMVIETLKFIGEQTGCYKSMLINQSFWTAVTRMCHSMRNADSSRRSLRWHTTFRRTILPLPSYKQHSKSLLIIPRVPFQVPFHASSFVLFQ